MDALASLLRTVGLNFIPEWPGLIHHMPSPLESNLFDQADKALSQMGIIMMAAAGFAFNVAGYIVHSQKVPGQDLARDLEFCVCQWFSDCLRTLLRFWVVYTHSGRVLAVLGHLSSNSVRDDNDTGHSRSSREEEGHRHDFQATWELPTSGYCRKLWHLPCHLAEPSLQSQARTSLCSSRPLHGSPRSRLWLRSRSRLLGFP